MPWTTADIPDQAGRTFLVTGATSGLGLETVRSLAARGANVVLATRDADKTAAVIADLETGQSTGTLTHLQLDLTELASVRKAADDFLSEHDHLDVLVNNAGVMATPLQRTADGFELQLGTNHLGHFALTGLLLPALLAAPRARIVSVSSGVHRIGRMDFDDLNWDRSYGRWAAYGRSKLANLLFTFELQSRLADARADAIAVAAHPGYAATHLQGTGPRLGGGLVGRTLALGGEVLNRVVAQDAASGALPQLFAATDPSVGGGSYWGPGGPGELRGHPAQAAVAPRARRVGDARRLWEASERLTGVVYDLAG